MNRQTLSSATLRHLRRSDADQDSADVVFAIAGMNFASFAADAGVEDALGAGSVQFQVLAAGIVQSESAVLRPGIVHAFRVNVSGAREVTLRVFNGGDGHGCDHAAWGSARFLEPGAKDPLAGGKTE